MTMLALVFLAGLFTGIALGGAYIASLKAKIKLYERYIEERLGGRLPQLEPDPSETPWKNSFGKGRQDSECPMEGLVGFNPQAHRPSRL